MCLQNPGQALGFACVAAVLAFGESLISQTGRKFTASFKDTVAIISIVVNVVKMRRETLGLSKFPNIIFRDVTIYFLVIFISHLGLIVSIIIARVCTPLFG